MRDADRLVATSPREQGAARGPDGGAVVLRDGRPVTHISPTVAVDAKGTSVPVHVTVERDALVIDVDHRGRNLTMPILVDPYVADDQRFWLTNADLDFNGWRFEQTGGFSTAQGGIYGRGLYIFSQAGVNYGAGGSGKWIFEARQVPGFENDAPHIFKADFGLTAHAVGGPFSCRNTAIALRSGSREPGGMWREGPAVTTTYTPYSAQAAPYGHLVCTQEGTPGFASTYPTKVHCLSVCNEQGGNPALGSPGNRAVLELVQAGGVASRAGIAYMGSSLIFQSEQVAPRLTIGAVPAGWTNQPFTAAMTANDHGLGNNSVSISSPAGLAASASQGGPCTNGAGPPEGGTPGSANKGDRNHPCTAPLPTSVSSAGLPEGSYSLAYSATDILGNVRNDSRAVRIDRTPPNITLSGSLYAARDTYVGSSVPLTLQATATDGTLATGLQQRSGATSVAVTLDGQPVAGGSVQQLCTSPQGSCALTANVTVTTEQLESMAQGEHTVSVTASDALNQSTPPVTFKFKVDTIEPDIFLRGSLAERDASGGRVLTEDSYRLVAEARDNVSGEDELQDDGSDPEPLTDPGAGLRDLVIRLDGQTVPTTPVACSTDPRCQSAIAWDWDTTSVPNGVHEISITATDHANNQDVTTGPVTIQHAPDQPPRANTVVRTTIRGVSGWRLGSAVAALGDVNGDGFADYAIGAPGASGFGRSAAGAVFLVLGGAGSSTIDLANPAGANIRFLLGSGNNRYCGTSVAAAGDVNGDEYDDLLVGCPGIDPALGSLGATSGSVHVVFGRPDPQSMDLATLGSSATAGFTIAGPSETAGLEVPLVATRPAVFGERLQNAPITRDRSSQYVQDVNGDGLGDIVVGDSAQNAAYVVYGKQDNATVSASSLGNAGMTIRGAPNTLTGYSATIAGDLDGDTLAEVVVGAPGSTSLLTPGPGAGSVVFGADGPAQTSDVNLAAPGNRAITLTSGAVGDRFGVTVAALGDTNLDSDPDIAIGTSSGAYVVRTLPATSRTVTADDGFRISGPVNGPILAGVASAPVAPMGDIDGDERADLIIGYPDTGGSRAYTILSPERSRTIAVSGLPGQRGSQNNVGTQADRSGAAVSGNTFQGRLPVTENAQAIIGAPAANPNVPALSAGDVYIISERTPDGPAAQPPEAQSSAESTPTMALLAERPPGLYQLTGKDWGTVRNKWSQLIMGYMRKNQLIDVHDEKRGWLGGHVRDNRATPSITDCGWIENSPEDVSGPFTGFRPPICHIKERQINTFAALVNCDYCKDGSDVNLRYNPKLVGPPPNRVPMFRNASPGAEEGGYDLIGYFPFPEVNGHPTQVRWRYITEHSKFVLVRWKGPLGDIPLNDQGERPLTDSTRWFFIERKWLPPKDKMCGGRTPTRATGEDPNGNDDRPQRDGWPRVCKQDGVYSADPPEYGP